MFPLINKVGIFAIFMYHNRNELAIALENFQHFYYNDNIIVALIIQVNFTN